MKSNTRLHSVVFQLTPTRTRCDLIIIANEKKEKIASGLLNPFLAHLKTAQEQIAKGGYSIVLEPGANSDAAWFTKGTVERFVRFVSTPEVLERVYTIESEILQIEEAIVIQGTNDLDHMAVNDNGAKPMGSHEGNKSVTDQSNEEKAIVLYKPGVHQPESSEQVSSEENSKVQLLKVLESRKIVLQKEQGMAFARAVAAGFDIDHMAPLLSFAECFGAARLMDACTRFMELWRKKHESGQWLEIEAPEPMSNQSEFSAMSASGIMLTSVANRQNESSSGVALENNGKLGERPPVEGQVPSGQHEYFQGQFPQPIFAPWPMHSPPGTVPVFPAYPVQGMPYYQGYPGNGPFYSPQYPANGDSRYDVDHKTGKRRLSMDDRDSDSESEISEMGNSRPRTEDGNELIKESRTKGGRSGKKKSGMVVIRNINYITSKAKDSASTQSGSTSGSESDTVSEGVHANGSDVVDKNRSRSSNRKERHGGSMDEPNLYNQHDTMNGKDSDGGHWQAFQNFLLRGADEENHDSKKEMFALEKDVKMKRHQNIDSGDPLALGGRDLGDTRNRRVCEIHEVNGTTSRRIMQSTDEVLLSGGSYDDARRLNYKIDMQSAETNGRRIMSRTAGDDFVIGSIGAQSDMGNLLDPLSAHGFERATNKFGREATHNMTDESFIVPFRSMSLEEVRPEDRAINMDSELPSTHRNSEDYPNGIRSQANYEPDALSLMPERGTERRPVGYDPALDYEVEVTGEGSTQEKMKKEANDVKEESKKSVKERKSKVASGTLDKRRTGGPGPIRKEKPSKMGLLEDARARAERLRSFKADIQKMKKEKEEEDLKRLEALKVERRKRIAARASSASAQKPGSSMQTRKLPTKLSPISCGGSKFSDSEPGASSPLQRSKIRTTSLGSSNSQKASKASNASNSSHMTGNRLTRSVSSLSEPKKESSGVTPDSKASMARIRRLSEPKTLSNPVTVTKSRSAEPVTKQKLSGGPDSKKISAAIVNLDKSKAATLPELKIRTSKGPSDIAQKKSVVKDPLKTNRDKSTSNLEDVGSRTRNDKMSHECDLDDSTIIEKTVVTLEYEKPSVPLLHQGGGKMEPQNEHNDYHATVVKNEALPEYPTIRAVPSPVDIVDRNPVPSRVQVQSNSHEVRRSYGEKVSSEVPNSVDSTAEEPYHAPHARNSSLEDPCTGNSDYGLAPPSSSVIAPAVKETAKAYVSDMKTFRVDTVPEALAKVQVKEPSKGFKRLLKFGKKNHTSGTGDQSVDLDNSSVKSAELDDNKTSVTSSSEVYTLKNLISQDETSAAGSASQKSSRHFSLFSPFRSKTSDKKLTT